MENGGDKIGTEPVEIPIGDTLDLHTFRPDEVASLVEEYLIACREANISWVRIIHGKGRGLLRDRVRVVLRSLPIVGSFSDAPPSAGGWGATVVELLKGTDVRSPEWCEMVRAGAQVLGQGLTPKQLARFSRHAQELLVWNRVVGLTAIVRGEEIAEKHFLDSIAAAPLIPAAARVLDVGSGGGFPGIPLKVVREDIFVTLVDGSRKKVSFLRQVLIDLEMEGIVAVHGRVERLAGEGMGIYDVVVSKAAFKLEALLRACDPLIGEGGRIIAMKGPDAETELNELKKAKGTGQFSVLVQGYELPWSRARRSLVVFTRRETE